MFCYPLTLLNPLASLRTSRLRPKNQTAASKLLDVAVSPEVEIGLIRLP
jgi:hypothetical protein